MMHKPIDRRRPIDIEDLLIWAYSDQRVDCGAFWSVPTAVTCTAVVAQVGALGCRVDGGGSGNGKAHPDAITIDQALMATAARGLLIHHAILRGRPRVLELKIVPDRCPRTNRIGRQYDDNRHWVGCLVRPTASPEAVVQSRQIYTDWWSGLRSVRLLLADSRLQTFKITGPRAPRAPWDQPKPRILPTLPAAPISPA